MPLVESGKDRIGKDYSKEAYGLFPRYRLDQAIEIEVERITEQQFHSVEESRKLLLESGTPMHCRPCFKSFNEAPKRALHWLTNGRLSRPTSVTLMLSNWLALNLSLIGGSWRNLRASSCEGN